MASADPARRRPREVAKSALVASRLAALAVVLLLVAQGLPLALPGDQAGAGGGVAPGSAPGVLFGGAAAQSGDGSGGGGGTDPVRLTYLVDATDAALRGDGKVRVTWRAEGYEDRVTAFCLQVVGHEYAVDQATFGPRPPWQERPTDSDDRKGKPACPTGFRALTEGLQGPLEATFVLDVRKDAFSSCGCEFNSYLGPDWGLVKAEALAIPFSYAFFEPRPTFLAEVRFTLPTGWHAEAPWQPLGEGAFRLAGGQEPTTPPLPRGFFTMGPFEPEPHAADAVGKEFVYVRLAEELKDRDALFTYLEKASPYYQSVYGDVVGPRVLVVSAGAPMFTGGLGATDSLFVHQNSSLDTIAHEYAHVWQRFQTIDEAGRSSIWLNEGDAELHGALSRVVTEVQPGFSMDALHEDFRERYRKAQADPELQAPLAAAAYGAKYEQVAYKKGLFTLVHLDEELRRLTRDAAGVREVLRELNLEYARIEQDRAARNGEQRLSNADALAVVNRVVQKHNNVDMLNFFRAYVWGNSTDQTCNPGCWPPLAELPPEAPVVFDALEVDPATPSSGQQVQVRVEVTNVRSAAEERAVQLLLDGEVAAERTVHLGPRERSVLTFTVDAGEAGPHEVRVAYLTAAFRTLEPADLAVTRVAPGLPPQAGIVFPLHVSIENAGEADAQAVVEVMLAGQRREATTVVRGGTTEDVTLQFLVREEGAKDVRVRVAWDDQVQLSDAQVRILPRDTDGDGVPDAQDAYPENPLLTDASPINDVVNEVPGPGAGVALVAVAVAAALVATRRLRGGR